MSKDHLHTCYTVACSLPRECKVDNTGKFRLLKAGKTNIAACLVYRNRVIAYGVNSYKTHPMAKLYSKNGITICLHAEIACIKSALRNYTLDVISRSVLYIARAKQDKQGKWIPGLAKPCIGCARCIAEFGITRVEYTQ